MRKVKTSFTHVQGYVELHESSPVKADYKGCSSWEGRHPN